MRFSRALMLAVAVAAPPVAGCGSTASPVVKTAPCEPAGGGWEVCDLGTLGGDGSAAVAVNDRGQVVGTADTTPPPRTGERDHPVISHAFLWENGELRDLGSLGGDQTDVSAINDGGQVVGNSQTATGAQHGFRWENGTMHDLSQMRTAYGINDRGQVVGISVDGSTTLLWEDGRTTTVASSACNASAWVNERGQVLGGCGASAFVWEAGRTTRLGPLPGGRNVYPDALGDRGQVVGQSSVASRHWHAFLWEDAGMTDLAGALPDHDSEAVAINANGQIAGFDGGRVLLWQNGHPTDLGVDAETAALDAPSALDINSHGHVVGTTTGDRAFIWADGRLRILGGLARGSQDESTAAAVNDHDVIVGTSLTEAGKTHAVVWRRAA